MKFILTFLILVPLLTTAQTLYSGKSDSKNDLVIQLNQDSTFILIESRHNEYYNEFRGTVTQLNDSVYRFTSKENFSQGGCRAIGDSILYISIDSTAMKRVRSLTLIYTNGEGISLEEKSKVKVSLDKSLFNSDPKNNYFLVTAGYKNPLTEMQVNTRFEIDDEFCFEIYAQEKIDLNVVIKNETFCYRQSNYSEFTVLKKR